MDTLLRWLGRTIAVLSLPLGVILLLAGVLVGVILPVAADPAAIQAGLRAQPDFYPALAPLVLPALVADAPAASASPAAAPQVDLAATAARLVDAADRLSAGDLPEADRAALLGQLQTDAALLATYASQAGNADLAATAQALAATAASLPADVRVQTAADVAAGVESLPPLPAVPEATPINGSVTLGAILAAIPAGEWPALARQIATADWLEAQVGTALAAAWRGERAALDPAELQAALRGDPGRQRAAQILALLRPCATAEVDAWAAGTGPLCNPGAADPAATNARDAIATGLASGADSLASAANPFALAALRFPLVVYAAAGADLPGWLTSARTALPPLTPQTPRNLALIAFAIPLVLLGLLVFFGTRSLRALALWAGLASLIAGGLIALAQQLAPDAITAFAAEVARSAGDPTRVAFEARLTDGLLRALAFQLQMPLQTQALILLIGGGGLAFLGWFGPRLLPIEEE